MKKFVIGVIVGLLIPAIGGYLYIKMGMMPVATASAPLPMEEKIAKMAVRARMAKDPVQQSPVPADEPNMTQGAHVYVDNCAFCHGFPGEKASFASKGMFPLPPQLLSGDDMVTDDPPGRIYWKVENGIRLTGMPGFKDMLTPTQMWQVSQLLQHADKLPEQTKAALTKPAALPVAPPSPTPASMEGKRPIPFHGKK
ncbi:MAG TPA: cytochrome c [Candidatus Angelobacter sp.]